MAWQPTQNVFDARFIGKNLIAWFVANQVAALAWANAVTGDPVTVLPLVLDFFENRRVITRFPALMINQSGFDTRVSSGDVDIIQITLEYELNIMHGSANWLATNSPRYSMAFESMARNVPKTSLNLNSKISFDGVLESLETVTDVLKTDGNAFLQTIQTQITWKCVFGAES